MFVGVNVMLAFGVKVMEGVTVMLGVRVSVGIGVSDGVNVIVGDGGKYSYAIGSPYIGNATAKMNNINANPNKRHPVAVRCRRRRKNVIRRAD